MYTACLRCNRALGANTELSHLPVGRRVAFDTTTGRIWVICTACGQWNLVPLDVRWEALAECDRLAGEAEARVSGSAVGLARTDAGLELLRVGGLPDEDIANWRYGRRLRVRQRWAVATMTTLGALALFVGIAAGRALDAPLVALWVAVFLGVWLVRVWRRPPRLWLRVADGEGGRYLLWPWQLAQVRVVDGVVLVLPHARGETRLRGARAVEALGRLLSEFNAADCAGVDVRRALVPVRDAEEMAGRPVARPGRGARRRARRTGQVSPPVSAPGRPWECLVELLGITYVSSAPPVHRLALEMAVTEERERAMMRARAEALGSEWRDEEEIGRIADDLLLPEEITERLRALRARRDAGA